MSATLTSAPRASQRVESMAESATLAMTQKARELAQSGVDVISLSVGEPDFVTPDYIREAAKKAIDAGHTSYTPVPGIQPLREVLAKKFKAENGIDTTAAQIIVSTGGKQSLTNVLMSIIDAGDEVIILSPFWVSYPEMVVLCEGKPVFVEGHIENDFVPDVSAIAAAITPRTKAIMYSSPSNPTGSTYPRSFFEDLAKIVAQHPQVMVIADEMYEYLTYEGEHFSIGSIEAVKDQVVTVNGYSKGFAMTGWRVGYLTAPLWLAKACNKIQGQTTSGTNSITQHACVVAMEDVANKKASIDKMREAYIRRRSLVVDLLREIPGLKVPMPKGAFYAFPDVSAYLGKTTPKGQVLADSDLLAMYLLEEGHIACVGGVSFGAPQNIRISYAAADEKLVEAISRLSKALAALK